MFGFEIYIGGDNLNLLLGSWIGCECQSYRINFVLVLKFGLISDIDDGVRNLGSDLINKLLYVILRLDFL